MNESAVTYDAYLLNMSTVAPAGGDRLSRVVDEPSPQLAFLADAVTGRRRTLGLTRADLRAAGGPSDSTMARIEIPSATTAYPRPSTLTRLDAALRWMPGSAAGCLDLREPSPLEQVDRAHDQTRSADTVPVERPLSAGPPSDPLDFDEVAVPLDVLREGLVLIQQNLRPADLPGGGEALAALIEFGQRLSAAHATEVLERFGASSRALPNFLRVTFAPYVSETVAFVGPTEREIADQRYRRWLIGEENDPDGRHRQRLSRKLHAIDM